MRGVSIYKVSQWLGHKSVDTTMIYAHLAPQDDEVNVLWVGVICMRLGVGRGLSDGVLR